MAGMADPYKNFVGRPDTDNFVVLFRQDGSRTFRPMFHCEALQKAPQVITDQGTGRPVRVWDSTAGAVEYIREHQQGQSGGEYRIKDREGNIVE